MHIDILAGPGKNLHVCLFEVSPGLSATAPAGPRFVFRHSLVILLPTLRAVAFVAAGFDATSIKNDVTTTPAVDAGLPRVVVFSAEVFEQFT